MPRARFDNLEPAKQQRLLDAARREFARHGYEHASINTILDDAGFSKGSFYYHFDDKADLALTLLTLDIELARTPFVDLAMPNTPDEFWAELHRLSKKSLAVLESDRVRYESFMRIGPALMTDPKLLGRVMPLVADHRARLAGFFERGVAVGALRRDIPIGTLMELIQAVKTTSYKVMYPGDRVLTDAELHSFTDLVIDLAKRICSR
jgi:AcrR family transcriptional regulator